MVQTKAKSLLSKSFHVLQKSNLEYNKKRMVWKIVINSMDKSKRAECTS